SSTPARAKRSRKASIWPSIGGQVTSTRMGSGSPGLLAHRQGLDEVPVVRLVDVAGLQLGRLEQDRLPADAGVGCAEAVAGEQVEVRVLLEPRLQVLGADQVVGVVVHRRAVGPVEARLDAV